MLISAHSRERAVSRSTPAASAPSMLLRRRPPTPSNALRHAAAHTGTFAGACDRRPPPPPRNAPVLPPSNAPHRRPPTPPCHHSPMCRPPATARARSRERTMDAHRRCPPRHPRAATLQRPGPRPSNAPRSQERAVFAADVRLRRPLNAPAPLLSNAPCRVAHACTAHACTRACSFAVDAHCRHPLDPPRHRSPMCCARARSFALDARRRCPLDAPCAATLQHPRAAAPLPAHARGSAVSCCRPAPRTGFDARRCCHPVLLPCTARVCSQKRARARFRCLPPPLCTTVPGFQCPAPLSLPVHCAGLFLMSPAPLQPLP
ncbi:hypothetical protein GGX14DRAFT_562010 [Mycena pura]|uniref:Uncharacterized protein n=1 Tax=Mycena pura TaxID=153505 RepID=A0AAD6YE79_9AGAR|nr:hypothetical protein GGX14DRAFT_562010 [Mycena pura]